MTEAVLGSTQAHIIKIESLLQSFNTTPANDNVAPARGRRFDSRPAIAACLAFFVFAPGCAAAAAFLLRADGTVPPLVTPELRAPVIVKTDRLPLEQWSAEAATRLTAPDDVRNAYAMAPDESPISIRGSLDDGTITTFTAVQDVADAPSVTAPDPVPVRKPRAKRHARRLPVHVAEAAPIPEPPEPGFFEKLFGTRLN